jgi:trimeric autotransporter adhesin
LGGADATNYSLLQPADLTGDITPAVLTVTGITADNKPYDGGTNATIHTGSASLQGIIAGDDVSMDVSGASGAFTNASVGDGKTVQISGITVSGASTNNYILTQPATTANITKAELTVAGITAVDKPYDQSDAASLNTRGAYLIGVAIGDEADVLLDSSAASGLFNHANAGTNKLVTISGLTITGSAVGNYTLIQPATTAAIIPLNLTVAGIVANSKVHDGNANATLDFGAAVLHDVLSPDGVVLNTNSYTATFATPDVGTAIAVTVTGLGLSGAQSGNYLLLQPTGLTADITSASVPGTPYITKISVSGDNVTLIGTNILNSAGYSYEVLSSPNLTGTRSAWVPVPGTSNVFAADGGFTNTFSTSGSIQFYIIQPTP